MSEPMFLCADCRVPTEAIRILDTARHGVGDLSYAAADAQPDIFWGLVRRMGKLRGRICPQCARVTIYGEAAPSHVAPQPPAPPPRPILETRHKVDHSAIDPPQPVPQHFRPEEYAAPVAAELVPTETLDWRVESAGDSAAGFATEPEAESHARALLREDPNARVFVLGPRARRYRVLP